MNKLESNLIGTVTKHFKILNKQAEKMDALKVDTALLLQDMVTRIRELSKIYDQYDDEYTLKSKLPRVKIRSFVLAYDLKDKKYLEIDQRQNEKAHHQHRMFKDTYKKWMRNLIADLNRLKMTWKKIDVQFLIEPLLYFDIKKAYSTYKENSMFETVEAARGKKKDKNSTGEYIPGSLDPKMAKSLGVMAELFENEGRTAYQEVLTEVKGIIARKLSTHRANLLTAINEEFGRHGMTQAKEHTATWMQAVVSDLLKTGFEPLVEAIKGLDHSDHEATAAVNPEVQERLFKLATKVHATNEELAKQIFSYAMDVSARKLDEPLAMDMGADSVSDSPDKEANKENKDKFLNSEGGELPESLKVQAENEDNLEEPPQEEDPDEYEEVALVEQSELTPQIRAQATAIANKLSAHGHRDLGRKILAWLKA